MTGNDYIVTTKLGEIIKVDAFVVPNSLASASNDLFEPERYSNYIKLLNSINGTNWDPNF